MFIIVLHLFRIFKHLLVLSAGRVPKGLNNIYKVCKLVGLKGRKIYFPSFFPTAINDPTNVKIILSLPS